MTSSTPSEQTASMNVDCCLAFAVDYEDSWLGTVLSALSSLFSKLQAVLTLIINKLVATLKKAVAETFVCLTLFPIVLKRGWQGQAQTSS